MEQHEHQGSTKSYVIGFIFSLVLTFIPLMLVLNHSLAIGPLVGVIVAMAVVQMFIQLFFFMHVREGEKPRFNVMALILGVVFVVTIVGGSVWVMTFNSQAF
jgi:cytochrome o ubiquinol oxidase subunit IV